MPCGVGRVLVSLVPPSVPPSCMPSTHQAVLSFCSSFAEEMAQEAAPLWVWNVAQRTLSRITLMLEAAEV